MFTSWGTETPRKYTDDEIRTALDALINEHRYGVVLRAKGIVPATDGGWIHFDYVPGESDVRRGSAQVTGRVCVIGSPECRRRRPARGTGDFPSALPQRRRSRRS